MNINQIRTIFLGFLAVSMTYLFCKEIEDAEKREHENEFQKFRTEEEIRALRARLWALEHPPKKDEPETEEA